MLNDFDNIYIMYYYIKTIYKYIKTIYIYKTSEINIQQVAEALENDPDIDKYETFQNINNVKRLVIDDLELDSKDAIKYLETLKHYKYIDELPELQCGCYIRWINLNNNKKKLTNGGIVVDIKIGDSDIIIVCKNNFNKIFQINMSQCCIFQKLTNSELIILIAKDFVNKK